MIRARDTARRLRGYLVMAATAQLHLFDCSSEKIPDEVYNIEEYLRLIMGSRPAR